MQEQDYQLMLRQFGLTSLSSLEPDASTPRHRPDFLVPIAYKTEFDSYKKRIQHLFARSAYAFFADVWTKLLIRATNKGLKADAKLFILMDSDVPLPTPATSLFWLMACETWPMTAPPRVFLSPPAMHADIFSPQPFVLPSMQPLETQSISAAGLTDGADSQLGYLSYTAALNSALTNHYRNLMQFVPAWWPPIYVPAGHIGIDQYWADRILRAERKPYGRFAREENWRSFAAGLGESVFKTDVYELDRIWGQRRLVMGKLKTQPGFPTCEENLNGAVGLHLRKFATSLAYLRLDSINRVPWTTSVARLSIDGTNYSTHIPNVLPRIWMGFTGMGDWNEDPAESTKIDHKAQRLWAEAYIRNRHHALNMLFDWMQDSDSTFDEWEREAVLNRTKLLAKAVAKDSNQIEAKGMRSAFGEIINANLSKIKRDSE